MRIIYLLYVLELVAQAKDFEYLSDNPFSGSSDNRIMSEKIKKIFEYTLQNYHTDISIPHMASMLNMTPESFCRYFKNKTQKTFVHFLMEVRIGNACRLLVEEDLNVHEISCLCGYNSISHFNHQFKAIKNLTPLEFRKLSMQ